MPGPLKRPFRLMLILLASTLCAALAVLAFEREGPPHRGGDLAAESRIHEPHAPDDSVGDELIYEGDGLQIVKTRPEVEYHQEALAFIVEGRESMRLEDRHVRIGGSFIFDDDQQALLAPGGDLDGNGYPDFLVETSTGGRSCCYEYIWLEWRNGSLVERDRLNTGAAAIHTAQLTPAAETPHVLIRDVQFLYWRASRAGSIAKDVALVFDDDGIRVQRELMAAPAPSEEYLNRTAEELRQKIRELALTSPPELNELAEALRFRHAMIHDAAAGDGEHLAKRARTAPYLGAARGTKGTEAPPPGWVEMPPPRLWDVMLELIYTGHEARAYRFLDDAWPEVALGKEAFRDDFRDTLLRGLFYARVGE